MAKKPESQRGQALVEFAIVLPILLILLFGIFEFSLALYNKAVITNASREAARAGTAFQYDLSEDEIRQIVVDAISANLITFGSDTIDPSDVTLAWPVVDGQNYLSITVTYDYGFFILPNFLTMGKNLTLSAETDMRLE